MPAPIFMAPRMNESQIVVGTLVIHPAKPEWGPGKVVRTKSGRVDVFFRDLPGDEARKFPVEVLKIAPNQEDQLLDHLPELIERRGKLGLPERRLTVAEARDQFLSQFPQGFDDPSFLGTPTEGERTYKWSAHERYEEQLGAGQGRALLAAGRIDELRDRLWKALGPASNLLAVTEQIAFRQGLADPDAATAYFQTLFDLIESGPEESPFAAHAQAVASLPSSGATNTDKWTIVTLVPYLARPDTFMFLKPSITKKAASALGFEIGYDPSPNWVTYRLVLRMSQAYQEQLADLDPRDYIDLQSFFWVTGDIYQRALDARQARAGK